MYVKYVQVEVIQCRQFFVTHLVEDDLMFFKFEEPAQVLMSSLPNSKVCRDSVYLAASPSCILTFCHTQRTTTTNAFQLKTSSYMHDERCILGHP